MSVDIRHERLNMGMSQTQLAEAAGVSYKVVNRLESGLGVRPENAKPLADFLGVLVTDLMPLKDKEQTA